ncbi:MAG: ribonuclease D [Hyphomicrobiaceae bacterium TMED74]|nr:ribonuclease D [Filomicrobium sp.]RPG36347.1 MAG: ribonuclease D [Hyphomicrobiaceae bacterium TMED74]
MQLITDTEALLGACSALATHDYVTVDTEFLREQTFWPQLCLIQMAGPGLEFLIDPLSEAIDLEPFFGLMANKEVVKVFHAGRQDIEIVFSKAGIIPEPIFDTQIAAMVCGFGESVGYVNLVKKVISVDVDKGARFTDWSRRPLSRKQLDYALGDVTHLRDVYHFLVRELETSGRSHWLAEEMATLCASETYVTKPEDAWKRLKMRVKSRRALAVLMELAAWREAEAQGQNVPRNRVLRDEALYDIANQAPTSLEKLGALRSLSQGFSKSQRGRDIIDAVQKGRDRDIATVPPLKNGRQLSAEATAFVDLLRVLLKANAAHYGVAPRLIADAGDLESIAVEDAPDVPALKGWRRELFGEDALRLKNGKTALTVENGRVVAISN